MDRYLEGFYGELSREWRGSLVKVGFIRSRNAKEYLHRLSKSGKVERVSWGWYFVPVRTEGIGGVFDFLRRDRNFKVLVGQTAASFWNSDFVHRNVYSLVVKDSSYRKALSRFAESRKWNLSIEVNENAEREIRFRKIHDLCVESPLEAAVECMQKWAFTDSFSIISGNSKIRAGIKRFYWKRISGTNVRVGQVISYVFKARKASGLPGILRRHIDESFGRVKEFE